jgi:hypothetical protein
MMHKGVEYMIAPTAIPGVWRWQFRIGDQVKTGRTETRLGLLAMRRVQLRIDRELKKAEAQPTPPRRNQESIAARG